MSIDSLKKLRIDGYKPKSVFVLVGDYPAWANDEPDHVCIRAVKGMDLRPLFGLPVSIIQIGDCNALLRDVMDAVEAVKPEYMAVAANAGAVGLTPDHERILCSLQRRYSCNF